MRVISGKYKGRKILVESKSDYRPTLTRIREDIFNLLLHNNDLNIILNEVILCDLFAGTGSIGIEALSRGIKKIGQNLIVDAYAPDNLIEAFHHNQHPLCMGVQWHPEFLITDFDKSIIKLFTDHAKNNV